MYMIISFFTKLD